MHVVGADYSAGTGAGGKTKCFGNAMNMTWIDWTKPNCSMQGMCSCFTLCHLP